MIENQDANLKIACVQRLDGGLLMNSGQMDNDYKASKEAFVAGMTGSSVFHVNLIATVGLVSPMKLSEVLLLKVPRRRSLCIPPCERA